MQSWTKSTLRNGTSLSSRPRKSRISSTSPPFHYLMIDGKGAPESQLFQDALAALYSMAYTVKFMLKSAGRTDFVVPPLETLWWGRGRSGVSRK